ncbi:universal stress protein [Paraburkholderia phymatum]|uniref:UspA domain protein n=1 Tax=Paraburkholderia phymatum (strain DSM 17167 / CIP 108236 / LMG 21445 / STM815) TaxID=391038 RepID=B2JVA9_PARP8|nr:universal stress protein [Paraburkholderia phymatum]ACC74886.1 UspA domain protein [Paraburkholderia phymatum STM815]
MANPVDAEHDSVRAFQRVLLAVDGSEASLHAAQYTNALFSGRAAIAVVSVVQNPRTLFPLGATTQAFLNAARDELISDARAALQRIEPVFCGAMLETEVIDLSKRDGDIVHALLDAVAHWQADLLVMGARHHRGLLRWVEGAVSEPVTRRANSSLLLVPENSRARTDTPPQRILFALDGSAHSLGALRIGLQLASAQTQLRAIYVIDRAVHLFDIAPVDLLEGAFYEEGRVTLDLAERIFSDEGHAGETALVETHRTGDDVPHAIVRDAEQWNADLLVVGTHGRRGIARWFLGSVAARTLPLADTPVLLVSVPELAQR